MEELSQKIIANQSEWAKTFLELNQSPEKLKGSTGTGEMDWLTLRNGLRYFFWLCFYENPHSQCMDMYQLQK